jgi:hypothetical protein
VADTNKERSAIPLLSIWIHPRIAMRELLDRGSLQPAYLFAAVSGIVNAWEFVQTSDIDNGLQNDVSKLLLAAGAGMISGIVIFMLLSLLFMYFGRWVGGTGTYRRMNTIVGWAMLPSVGMLILALIEYSLYGEAYLAGGEALVLAQEAHPVADVLILIADLFLLVYQIVFLVAGLAEGHRFKTSQGGATLLIFVILYLVFWIAVQALSLDI